MSLFKKSLSDKNKSDIDIIKNNYQFVDVLISISHDEEFNKKLSRLKETLHYLQPSVNDDVIKFDKDIKNKLDDLRSILTKKDINEDTNSVYDELITLIARRNSRL